MTSARLHGESVSAEAARALRERFAVIRSLVREGGAEAALVLSDDSGGGGDAEPLTSDEQAQVDAYLRRGAWGGAARRTARA